MLSIQGKLTFILVSLIAPLVVISLLSVYMLKGELARVDVALDGARFIKTIWSVALDPSSASDGDNLATELSGTFGPVSLGVKRQLEAASNADAHKYVRMRAARGIITNVAGKSKLINLLSEDMPTLAIALFDRSTELAFRADYLVTLVCTFHEKAIFNPHDAMAVQIAAGQFKTLADSVGFLSHDIPMQLAEKNGEAIRVLGAAYREQNKLFQTEMAEIVLGTGEYQVGRQIPIEEMTKIGESFNDALASFWFGGMEVALKHVEREQQRLNMLYAIEIGVLGAIVVFGIGAAVFMRRSILQQTHTLEAAFQQADTQNQALEELRQQAEYESMHDVLTGLSNRRFVERELVKRVETARMGGIGLAALHIDLDRFKQINDMLGHAAGDYVLEHVANVLNRETRANDVVARVGGDEFLIVSYTNGSQETLGRMAARIIESLSRPIQYADNLCQFGASVGINIAIGDELAHFDTDLFLANADIALYRAKENGRGRYAFYNNALRAEAEIGKSLSDDLMLGLKRGEFYPVYQPQVDARTGEWIGVEALARWSHPQKGNLSPGVFLPIARRLGVLAKIDEAIMENALQDMANWDAMGLRVPRLSLNLSEHRLADPDFLIWLETHNLPIGRLSFEVLETVFSDDFDDVRRYAVDRLQELNIGLEMDDFGTGHASLAGLLSFSPYRLKIARELAGPVDTSPRHARLVSGIVDVATALDIEVLAEGVERELQADILRELGCTGLQGYLFAIPMPAAELPKWWHQRSIQLGRKSG